jgi:Sec-independent protein translocase protein TatA
VFGLSFTECAVVLVVGLVVLGPKDLPRYLRTTGQLAGRARDWIHGLEREQLLGRECSRFACRPGCLLDRT